MPKKELIYVGDGLIAQMYKIKPYSAEEIKYAVEFANKWLQQIEKIFNILPG